MPEEAIAARARTVVSVAGSDSSGGAGIQADLKAGSACGVYVATAITALTAQNPAGVSGVYPVTPEQLAAQLQALSEGLPIDAVKVGLLGNVALGEVLLRWLEQLAVPVVVDPVLVATSGATLAGGDGLLNFYREQLFPRATVITPNLGEAATLLETEPVTEATRLEPVARALARWAPAVLLKGGHGVGAKAVDCLVSNGPARQPLFGNAAAPGADSQPKPDLPDRAHPLTVQFFSSPRLVTEHTHGSGCCLSTAVAAGLAQGLTLAQSVAMAKSFIQGAIEGAARLRLVPTNGPVHPFHSLW